MADREHDHPQPDQPDHHQPDQHQPGDQDQHAAGAASEQDSPWRFTQEFWDERYAAAERLWSGQPNPRLVEEVTGLPPSTVLDVGCGEGADAIWLAQQGWRVTALDISPVVLTRAEGHAREVAPEVADRITWVQADLTAWEPGEASYGLVSAQFAHLPQPDLGRLHAQLASVVRPGGTLLVVGNHPDDLHTGLRHGSHSMMPTAQQVAQSLDPHAWEVVGADARTREQAHPETGEQVSVTDAVMRARRRLVGAGSVWLAPQEDPRGEGSGSDERSTLTDYLRHYRTTFELKCAGLDAGQLARRSVPPSTLSLLGLLRHLAGVEQVWFRTRLAGLEGPRHFRETGPESEFDGAVADDTVVAQAWTTWREEVAFAEAWVASAPSMDHVGADGSVLRDILVHMIEEYARHCGHADLLRECIDGRVGQ